MIQTGIYKIEQLIKKGNHLNGCHKFQKKISIRLYEKALSLPAGDQLAEAILLLYVDENGAYKRTYSHRFDQFDQDALKLIRETYPGDMNLDIHDMAVSDGRTAVDFYQKLAPHFKVLNYYASDYDGYVKVSKYKNIFIVFNRNNKIIEFTLPPFVFNVFRPNSWIYYPINNLIFYFYKFFILPKIYTAYEKGEISIDEEIRLFCPEALRLSQEEKGFHLLAHDILDLSPFVHKMHVIRTMNVLNPSYFNGTQIRKILGHILDGLKENGLLIMGSNQNPDSLVHGGIYQKKSGKFHLLWKSGEGASIKSHIECQI